VAIKDTLLPEYDHEMAMTRRVLERAPEADFGWTPHEKSWPLGKLASHIAYIPTWIGAVVERTEFDIGDAPEEELRPGIPASRDDLLKCFDRHVADGRRLLEAQTDPQLFAMWTFKKQGQTAFTVPRLTALRGFVLNHNVHHRGQMTVYLRLRDVPVPAIYGRSADEG
jgi:uncharacterized damage-inducible protein DinB